MQPSLQPHAGFFESNDAISSLQFLVHAQTFDRGGIVSKILGQPRPQGLLLDDYSVALLSCVADMSNTFRLIICVVECVVIVSSEIILLGEGMVFAPYRTNDVIFVVRMFWRIFLQVPKHIYSCCLRSLLSVRSDVKCNVFYNVVYNCSNGVSTLLKFTN